MAKSSGKKWEKVTDSGRNHPILFIDTVFEGYRAGHISTFFGISFNPTHYRQFDGARWWLSEEIEKYIASLKQKERESPGILLAKANEYYEMNKVFLTWAKHIAEIDFRKVSGEKLREVFEGWTEKISILCALVYTGAFLDRFYTDEIIAIVNRRVSHPEKQFEILRSILSVEWGLESHLEKVSLLHIAHQIKDKKLLDAKMEAKKHAERFGPVYMMPFQNNPLRDVKILDDAIALAKDEKKYRLYNDKIQEMRNGSRNFLDVIQSLNLSISERRKIDTLRRWTFVSNNDDPYVMGSLYALNSLWKEMSQRLGIKVSELILMRLDEVRKSFDTGEVSNLVRKDFPLRSRAALVWEGSGVRLITGELCEAYRKREIVVKKTGEVTHIVGVKASLGKATGKVFILRSVYDVSEIETGDILVAPYTYPAIVAAMQKAAAIVTDQGGLLSHAAIVARELKKPCIIGTKIATKVLKDGDVVEVDANEGVVKIITRAGE